MAGAIPMRIKIQYPDASPEKRFVVATVRTQRQILLPVNLIFVDSTGRATYAVITEEGRAKIPR